MEFAWSPARLTGWLGGYLEVFPGALATNRQYSLPGVAGGASLCPNLMNGRSKKVVAGDRASGGHNKTEPRSLQNPEWLGIEEMARKEKLLPKVEAIR